MKMLVVAAVSLALGGCMRIYQDPELPDVTVSWYAGQCDDATPEIRIIFTSLEDNTVFERVAACEAEQLDVEDVPRHRFRVDGELLLGDGTVLATSMDEVDLRNSVDQDAYLYFDIRTEVRVRWQFDMGATCQSLGALLVVVDYYSDDFLLDNETQLCSQMAYAGSPGLPPTPITVELRAVTSDFDTVAVSPRSTEFTLVSAPVDLGTLVLTPCGAACPQP
jgi:hypothetical protein